LSKIKEILSDTSNGNPTYERVTMDQSSINERIKRESKDSFGITVNENNCLPIIQIVPKFHKIPTDFRVIIASKTASTKPLSRFISNGLKLIQTNVKKYCMAIERNLGIRCYWIIDNNVQILNTMDGFSKEKRAQSINTFDFGQMYTNLRHQDINQKMTEVVTLAYGRNEYMWLNEYRGSWYEIKGRNAIKVSKYDLLSMIDYLIHNTYFLFGDQVYRQIVGIPMGTDCAPYLANLTLFAYEFKYMLNKLKHGERGICRKLSNNFRYIDDITSINDDGVFGNIYHEIYPDSLVLKKVNGSPTQANVLDINITVWNGEFICKLYDKRVDFPFKCNVFPSPLSNISSKCLYNVYYTELLRYYKICSTLPLFLNEVKNLNQKLVFKHYKREKLCITFLKFARRHMEFAGFRKDYVDRFIAREFKNYL
jgi:hypothetical protein